MTSPRIAIVDGFFTANYLATALKEAGACLVHVLSSPDIPEFFTRTTRLENYETDLGYIADVDALVDAVSRLAVDRVIPGTESGVILADVLSARLKTPCNPPEQLPARRDKALMAEVVAAAGLATPLGRRFETSAEAVAWYKAAGLGEAVAKPLASAGTDNVWFCGDAQELRLACDRILSSRNAYGAGNRQVLVQERIDGPEYYLNTVSHDGVHRTPEIWRYTKRPGSTGAHVYDYEEPVPVNSAEARTLRGFVYAVLDALGVADGCAHTEVMLTERGPVLIEVGARIGGATLPHIVQRYCGVSQIGLYTATLLDPARLAEFDDETVTWTAAVRLVQLINRVPGEIRSMDWVTRLDALPTAVATVAAVKAGSWLDATNMLGNSPGLMYLAAEDPADVERDYRAIRSLEEAGVYTSVT